MRPSSAFSTSSVTRSQGMTGPELLSTRNGLESHALVVRCTPPPRAHRGRSATVRRPPARTDRAGRADDREPIILGHDRRAAFAHHRGLRIRGEPVDSAHRRGDPRRARAWCGSTSSRRARPSTVPRGGSGGQRVGLGQRVEQAQRLDRLTALATSRSCRRRRGHVAPRRRAAAGGAGPSPAARPTSAAACPIRGPSSREQVDADLGVIPRVALADVVQQRAHHQQVGTIDAVDQRRGVHRGLPQVPIDGVTCDRRCAAACSARPPTRGAAAPRGRAGRAPRSPVARPCPHSSRSTKKLTGLVGPGIRQRGRGSAPADRGCGARCGAVSSGSGRDPRNGRQCGSLDTSTSARSSTTPSRSTMPPPRSRSRRDAALERAGERRVDAQPHLVARPRDASGRGRDVAHELVGVGVAERARPRRPAPRARAGRRPDPFAGAARPERRAAPRRPRPAPRRRLRA